ncbi:hypothetical protein QUF49_13700 [Fictibacillus sp. b24]|nr:hypothetical protein [Fictibacillus sp. b24]MDM5317056.1 hypothetical protein [Fictibacillus sp. b24]
MIGVKGARLLRDRLAGETLIRNTYECGYRLPHGKRALETEINHFQEQQ